MFMDYLSLALIILLPSKYAMVTETTEDFCGSKSYKDNKWYNILEFRRHNESSYYMKIGIGYNIKFNRQEYLDVIFPNVTNSQNCRWCLFVKPAQTSTSHILDYKYKIGPNKVADYFGKAENAVFEMRTGKLCDCQFGTAKVGGIDFCYYPMFVEKSKEIPNYFNKDLSVIKPAEKGNKIVHDYIFYFHPHPTHMQLYDTVLKDTSLDVVLHQSSKDKLIAYEASKSTNGEYYWKNSIAYVKYAFEIKNGLIAKIITKPGFFEFNKNYEYGFLTEDQNLSQEMQASYFTNISVAKNLSFLCFVRQESAPKALSDHYCEVLRGNLSGKISSSKSNIVYPIYGAEFESLQKYYRSGDIYVQLQKSETSGNFWKLVDRSPQLSLKKETELIVIVANTSKQFQILDTKIPSRLHSCLFEVDSHFNISARKCSLTKNGIITIATVSTILGVAILAAVAASCIFWRKKEKMEVSQNNYA